MNVAMDRATSDRDFAVFADMLPGIGYFDTAIMPRFLAMKHWVDLRAGPESAVGVASLCHTIGNVGRMNPCLAQGCDGFVSESPLEHTG